MITIQKTYKDFNGIEHTENFMFNFTEAEITELQYDTIGGLDNMIRKIVETNDIPAIVSIFKKIVLDAYGEKSPDGKHFYKSEDIKKNFASTQAYSDIFMELATDSTKASEFINGVVPKDKVESLNCLQ